jgi:hypothetical protein
MDASSTFADTPSALSDSIASIIMTFLILGFDVLIERFSHKVVRIVTKVIVIIIRRRIVPGGMSNESYHFQVLKNGEK